GRSRAWWLAALVIQFWHHIEHALLQGQVIAGQTLFGSPVPTSIVQLWFPRLELQDRKSTRLNSSHGSISYAVFCLKKKKKLLNSYLDVFEIISHDSRRTQ